MWTTKFSDKISVGLVGEAPHLLHGHGPAAHDVLDTVRGEVVQDRAWKGTVKDPIDSAFDIWMGNRELLHDFNIPFYIDGSFLLGITGETIRNICYSISKILCFLYPGKYVGFHLAPEVLE